MNKNPNYLNSNQCAYCGRKEEANPDFGEYWWFAIDNEGDKICPLCQESLVRQKITKRAGKKSVEKRLAGKSKKEISEIMKKVRAKRKQKKEV